METMLPPNIYHTPISKVLHKHTWESELWEGQGEGRHTHTTYFFCLSLSFSWSPICLEIFESWFNYSLYLVLLKTPLAPPTALTIKHVYAVLYWKVCDKYLEAVYVMKLTAHSHMSQCVIVSIIYIEYRFKWLWDSQVFGT